MRLAHLHARGFRCFGEVNPLNLQLQPGLSILVGENDAGKSAIIDAIRLALGVRSEDRPYATIDDFHVPRGANQPVNEFLISCKFIGLNKDEQSRFIEWCSLDENDLVLHISFRAQIYVSNGQRRTLFFRRSGENCDGPAIEGALREYIATTYLRPLRDASQDLRSGRRSRLSQILVSLNCFRGQDAVSDDASSESATLATVLNRANLAIESNLAIETARKAIDLQLGDVALESSPLNARLTLANQHQDFQRLLERLELGLTPPPGQLHTVQRGLGLSNLLFMAAELLLLQDSDRQSSSREGPSLLLIEEPEAHLHPQLLARFMQMLQDRATKHGVQIVITSHSPYLAAAAELESLILVANANTFPLDASNTMLESDDYGFLRRFLDSTKANLFFARAVLIVEGDSEVLLFPTIAKKLGRPFDRWGISIVNTGHVGLFRYSRIFQRRYGSNEIPIKVALVTDLDIKPQAFEQLEKRYNSRKKDQAPTEADVGELSNSKKKRSTKPAASASDVEARRKRLSIHDGGPVLTFVADRWTLEFDLMMSGCIREVAMAIEYAKKNAETVTDESRKTIAEKVDGKLQAWKEAGLTTDQIAAEIIYPLRCGSVSKPSCAEQLAQIIEESPESAEAFRMKMPPYIVSAIEYLTQKFAETGHDGKVKAEATDGH